MANNPSNLTLSSFDQLEQEIGNIQHRFRLEILHILKKARSPMEFQEILRQITVPDVTSSKLSYHLGELKNSNYIIKENQHYFLTSLGEEFANKLDEIKQILESRNAAIMIRTSKYTFEPFDRAKIIQNLMKEANMPIDLAQNVAEEAKRRLEASKVTYLTAPLIREVINAILIERRLEDYRHKLTRLGLPPYDIKTMFEESQLGSINDLKFHLGSVTIEQFVLLNQLSQKQADLLLSGACNLTNLSCFSSNPLEMILSGNKLVTLLNNLYSSVESNQIFTCSQSEQQQIKSSVSQINRKDESIFHLPISQFSFYFHQLFELIMDICPNGIAIFNFEDFLSHFFTNYKTPDLIFLLDQCFLFNSQYFPVILQFSLDANFSELNPFLEYYINSLQYPIQLWSRLPVLQIHVPKSKEKTLIKEGVLQGTTQASYLTRLLFEHHVNIDQFIFRGHPNAIQIFSPTQLNLCIENPNQFEIGLSLETLYLNLPKMVMDAKKDEKVFYSILEQRIYSAFDFFERKWELLVKNLPVFHSWKYLISLNKNVALSIGETKNFSDYKEKITLFCGISLYGLDDAIYLLSGLNMREQATNSQLAGRILNFAQQLIKKQNDVYHNIFFTLADPIPQPFILNSQTSLKNTLDESYANSGKSIRTNFALYHHFSEKTFSIQKLEGFYSSFGTEFKSLSIECLVDSQFLNNPKNQISLLEYFFNSAQIRLCISRIYKNEQMAGKHQSIYTRYLDHYSDTDQINMLSLRKDILEKE